MKEKVHGWSGDISKLFDIDSKTYEEINTGVTYPDKDLLLNYIVAIGSVVSLPFTVLPASALIVGNWLNFGHLNNICNHCVSYKNAMETSWCKILDTKNKNKGIDVGILLHWVIDSLTPVHDISLIAKHPIDTTTIHNNYEKCIDDNIEMFYNKMVDLQDELPEIRRYKQDVFINRFIKYRDVNIPKMHKTFYSFTKNKSLNKNDIGTIIDVLFYPSYAFLYQLYEPK